MSRKTCGRDSENNQASDRSLCSSPSGWPFAQGPCSVDLPSAPTNNENSLPPLLHLAAIPQAHPNGGPSWRCVLASPYTGGALVAARQSEEKRIDAARLLWLLRA